MVHLAAYSPITPLYASVPPEVYWSPLRKALQQVAAPTVNGAVRFPTTPGIGIELPQDLLNHFMVAPSQGRAYHDLQS